MYILFVQKGKHCPTVDIEIERYLPFKNPYAKGIESLCGNKVCVLYIYIYSTYFQKYHQYTNLAGALRFTCEPIDGKSRRTVFSICVSNNNCSAPTVLTGLHL